MRDRCQSKVAGARAWALVFGLVCGSTVFQLPAQTEPPSRNAPSGKGKPTAKPPLEVLGNGAYLIGRVRLDTKRRTVTFPAEVNLNNVLIEYALVGSYGKLHESLFRTEVEPYHVHLAMLFLGVKPPVPSEEGAPPPGVFIGTQSSGTGTPLGPSPPPVKGTAVDFTVSWRDGDKEKTVPVEDWILNKATGKSMSRGPWKYNGSLVIRGLFLAQREDNFVAIIDDPAALVNNPRPGRENDEIWLPNQRVVPPPGTPVTLTFRLVKEGEKDPKLK